MGRLTFRISGGFTIHKLAPLLNCNFDMKRSITTLAALTFAYITFIGAVFFSVASQAAIREAGTFVPVACGKAVSDQTGPLVSEVCMGSITGEAREGAMGAFEFRDANGKPAVYRVTEVQNLLIKLWTGGTRSQVFMVGPNGDQVSMKVNRMGDLVLKASGQIGEAKFVVPAFEQQVVTL